ncbi:MAG: epoxyqueuosine reductase QueH [Coriobacteriia bacterium]|nr:epoxyqueuosine reductase QueH [Coriobacteriia bacterium]
MPKHVHTLLLHCCCAPCTTIPLAALQNDDWQVSLFFFNPNIQPQEEYQRRLMCAQSFGAERNSDVVVGEYCTDNWEKEVGALGGPYPLIEGEDNFCQMLKAKKQRCRACYDLRFTALVAHAVELGVMHVDTTLSISPYQFSEEIQLSLEGCARQAKIQSLGSNWSASYGESVRLSRTLGLYRQNYCGCRFSKEEAFLEREMARVNKEKRDKL